MDNEFSRIKLSSEAEKVLERNIKIGVLKELHLKNMFTDSQLIKLIQMQN